MKFYIVIALLACANAIHLRSIKDDEGKAAGPTSPYGNSDASLQAGKKVATKVVKT